MKKRNLNQICKYIKSLIQFIRLVRHKTYISAALHVNAALTPYGITLKVQTRLGDKDVSVCMVYNY